MIEDCPRFRVRRRSIIMPGGTFHRGCDYSGARAIHQRPNASAKVKPGMVFLIAGLQSPAD
jgi:hypothetical protein